MVLKIDKRKCVGCMLCVNTAAEFFAFDDKEGKAKVIKQPEGKISDDLQSAVESCPGKAISV